MFVRPFCVVFTLACLASCSAVSDIKTAIKNIGDIQSSGKDGAGSATDTTTAKTDTSGTPGGNCATATGPVGFHSTCDYSTVTGECHEQTGSFWGQPASAAKIEAECTKNKGTFSATAHCPTAGLVGRCLFHCGASEEVLLFMYKNDEAMAKMACETGAAGKWLGK